MNAVFLRLFLTTTFVAVVTGGFSDAAETDDPLRRLGLLDVTTSPYGADPKGTVDSTDAIQRAVNAARDLGLVCFFPEGTYLISETISCEQQVQKLNRPRQTDGRTQHYWDLPQDLILIGSTKGRRPVLRLSSQAQGFDDPQRPKVAVHIWAQTRDDAPGREEPQWGKEQPNISFNNIFRGIDIDVRGHAGAIGIRHTGSQGSTLLDCRIDAEGAYAGMNNCCGQGGGTYNVEVIGGRYGIVIEPSSRFPLLTACQFQGQTDAAITYTLGGSQVPTLLVGCRLEPAGDCVVDFTTQRGYAGISLVDCLIGLPSGGVVARTRKPENIYIEDCYLRGAEFVCTDGARIPASEGAVLLRRYSSHTDQGVHIVNGTDSTGEIADWEPAPTEPSLADIRQRHYSPSPSFEDADAVAVTAFGARGDGATDDTEAFRKAIAASDHVFVPKGQFLLTGTLELGPRTHLFGLTRTLTSLGSSRGRRGPGDDSGSTFTITTPDDPQASPGLSFLSVRGRIDWRSGQSVCMLASGSPSLSGQGGGRFYGVMAMGRPLVLEGIRRPTAFYSLNVERVLSNPQSEIRDCSQLRVYYFKVEAGTINRADAGDGNTPCRISNSEDVRIYCMYGNVRKLADRPMLEVVNSEQVLVAQLKAFQPGEFPHLAEVRGESRSEVPSTDICSLFVRDASVARK